MPDPSVNPTYDEGVSGLVFCTSIGGPAGTTPGDWTISGTMLPSGIAPVITNHDPQGWTVTFFNTQPFEGVRYLIGIPLGAVPDGKTRLNLALNVFIAGISYWHGTFNVLPAPDPPPDPLVRDCGSGAIGGAVQMSPIGDNSAVQVSGLWQ